MNVRGGAASAAQIAAVGREAKAMGVNVRFASTEMATLGKRTFVTNQLLFTARRLLFFVSLGAIGAAAAVLKMGFAYDSAMNQATVALQPVIKGQGVLAEELNKLFKIAALTPFTFQDITTAFRSMYAGFQNLGISIQSTNTTIQSIADILSFTGKTGVGSFNRIAIALQHLANLGRPTGQVLLQLARDGIPIYTILRKELGLTEDQLKNISQSGVSAIQVFDAINKFTQSAPGYAGAALRQSNRTLAGAVSTFRDLVSQASGRALGGTGGGLFGGLRSVFAGVNTQLAKFYDGRKPLTFTVIAQAFDKELSPKTHIVLNLFYALEGTIQAFVGTLIVLAKVISFVIGPFLQLFQIGGKTNETFKFLGYWLGITLGLFIAWRSAVIAAEVAAFLLKTALIGLALAERLVTEWQVAMLIKQYELTAVAPLLSRLLIAMSGVVVEMGAAFILAEGGIAGAAAALQVLVYSIPVIGWIIGLTTLLVILYFRWKRFHDIVNETVDLFKHHEWVQQFVAAFVPLISVFKQFQNFYDILIKIKNLFTGGGGKAWWKNAANLPIDILKQSIPFGLGSKIPSFAAGGQMPYSGMALVGERGPEMVYLPAGARVVPQAVGGLAGAGALGSDGGDTAPIVVQVILDGNVLAQGVARANQRKRARR